LGRYFIARCNKSAGYTTCRFDGTKFSGDFEWRDIARSLDGTVTDPADVPRYLERIERRDLGPEDYSLPLNWLWSEAKKEWSVPSPA
jgi:hypothetical protein